MNYGKIIGTVTLNKTYPSLTGVTLKLMRPVDRDQSPIGNVIVGADTVASRIGDLVFWVSACEAAFALDEQFNPASVAITGIIDHVPGTEVT